MRIMTCACTATSFETFGKYVDDALNELKDTLKQNAAIASIVNGSHGRYLSSHTRL